MNLPLALLIVAIAVIIAFLCLHGLAQRLDRLEEAIAKLAEKVPL